MPKVFIIGSVASGKTTLAKRLSKGININFYELDTIVYEQTEAGRYKRNVSAQQSIINDIDKTGSWIFEGVHRTSYEQLLEKADVIILLHPTAWRRRVRIMTRFIKQKLGLEACHYKPDFKMLVMMYKWTSQFNQDYKQLKINLNPYEHKLLILEKAVSVDKLINLIKQYE